MCAAIVIVLAIATTIYVYKEPKVERDWLKTIIPFIIFTPFTFLLFGLMGFILILNSFDIIAVSGNEFVPCIITFLVGLFFYSQWLGLILSRRGVIWYSEEYGIS